MNSVGGILTTLNDPELVVRFQQICGIEALAEDKSVGDCRTNREGKSEGSNGTEWRTNGSTNRKIFNKAENSIKSSMNASYSTSRHTIHNDGKTDYLVHNRFLYYIFHFGAALGNEIFYMTFFPFWFWNIDGYVGRRICLFWCIFMYAGQALKDVLRLPRPAAPPVIRVERLYELEYGMPSTHAMVGAGMPFTIYFLTVERYNYDSQWMLAGAILWCTLVCCSRLYLGMHSILDVLAGLLFVFLLMLVCFPYLDTVDYFILHSSYSPLVCVAIPVILCLLYPTPDRWSTARGDTTLILAVGSGISIGHWISYRLGVMSRASTSPPYDIIEPTWTWAGLVIVRMFLGIVCVVCLRAGLKAFSSTLVHAVVDHCCPLENGLKENGVKDDSGLEVGKIGNRELNQNVSNNKTFKDRDCGEGLQSGSESNTVGSSNIESNKIGSSRNMPDEDNKKEGTSHKCEVDRRPCVELPIKFLTYSLLSAVSLHAVPLLFRSLGIERETFFTEI